jgi:hypothetical protein
LTNCVFTNNSATSGGGMYNHKSLPTLTNCVFSDNSATSGGGIYNHKSLPTLTNCVFSANSAHGVGGGMYNASASSPTLTSCVFTDNSATAGGGILNYDLSSPTLFNCTFSRNSSLGGSGGGMNNDDASSPVLVNCVFNDNTSGSDEIGGAGGGMYNSSSSPILLNCVLTGNKAFSNPGSLFGNGGGMYNSSSSPTLTNCLFSRNSANKYAGAIRNNSSSPTLINCTFANNTADEGGAIHHHGGSTSRLANCILWGNLASSDNFNQLDGNWTNLSVVPIVVQAWKGDARAMSVDPLFNNKDNPIGADGIWFTDDDGLRLKPGSPAINAGQTAFVYFPVDNYDLDEDGDKTERFPYDILGRKRVMGSNIDLGPYEFDPAFPPPLNLIWFKVEVFNSDEVNISAGTATGGGMIAEGNSTTLSATPSPGYLFTSWSGDVSGTSNPLTITVNADINATANFARDLNDDDGDNLSNYDELVTHLTKADDNDTDNDGLLDNEEIQIGTDPKSSDATLFNFFSAKSSTDQSTARTTALAEGRTAGINAVKAKPGDYGLRTELDLNASVDSAVTTTRTAALAEGRTVGIEAVKANPSQHGLYTQADLNASVASSKTAGIAEGRTEGVEEGKELGRSEGQATGIAAVKADPTAHSLVTKDAYDQMVEQLINSSDSGSTTPYTDGWHYYPSRGWMWTNRTSYPYFYDSSTKAWMYFKSGEDKPRFYNYGTKTWVTLGE